ncbi:hypothetical protein N9N63_03770 [Amylibacter sp.]|nr:hypothetical protein [Amylibacter sp.]
MKVILFCGGKGTRIRAASENVPKPLLNVGGLPIILRLMAMYSAQNVNEFILATGHLGNTIKEYFDCLNFNELENSKIDKFLKSKYGSQSMRDWIVNIEPTGECNIGTRLYKLKHHFDNEEFFFANYSDSVSTIDISQSLDTLKSGNYIATIAAVKQSQYYHWLKYDTNSSVKNGVNLVKSIESSDRLKHRINGGYMCLKNEIFDHMNFGEELVEEPFNRLISASLLACYETNEYWRSIDTYKDLLEAEEEITSRGFRYV